MALLIYSLFVFVALVLFNLNFFMDLCFSCFLSNFAIQFRLVVDEQTSNKRVIE